jgi:ATP-dependent RNA helicase DHX8/PRP22
VFQAKLGQVGSDFPEWFVKNLDRLIVTMHPKYKRKAAKAKAKAAKANPSQALADDVKQLQSRKFPGLSVPDQEWSPAEKYVEERTRREPEEKLPASISMDDTMVQLAAVAARRNDRPAAEDYLDGEPSAKRQRQSEPRGGHRERDVDQRYGRDQGYNDRPRDNGYADRGRPRPMLDERPVLYKIYNGVVQNIRDFGAFVSLEGLQGRVEGMSRTLGVAHSRHGTRIQYHRRTSREPGRGVEAQR